MTRGLLLVLIAAGLVAGGERADAYLKLGTRVGSSTVTLKWQRMPVRYFVANRGAQGVSAAQLEGAVVRAFDAWDAIETAELSTQFVGTTSGAPVLNDGMSTIGFVDRPDQDRVLGATNFLIDTISGEIVESDVYLNAVFPWSVNPSGDSGRFDVESIALHEVGHMLGLGHSALGETELRAGGRRVLATGAAMFPIAFSAGTIEGRVLHADDIAGLSDTYPNAQHRGERGSMSGTVVKNGRGVLGAHVIAFNTRTGRMVAGFTLTEDGRFVIGGLEAGPHIVRVEPLDDGDIESFFDASFNVDMNFRVKFHDRVVVVPRGGGASSVAVTVVPK